MAVKIGHASSDENNKAKGGKAGDQTSKEVAVRDWYIHKNGWTVVFRAKDENIAEKIAKTMENACKNNNIGYDQSNRTSLYEQAKSVNFDVSKVGVKCECDCSSLVAVCICAAGIQVSKNMYTGNQKEVIMATSAFELLSDKKYLTKYTHLKRGDILLGAGHTAIVLSNGKAATEAAESAKSFSNNLVGVYSATASNLNIRSGAGITKNIITTIPRGTEVRCYGYYTKVLGVNWLYIQFTYKNQTYTGFASFKYLSKQR